MKQGQLSSQPSLLTALFGLFLKTSEDGDRAAPGLRCLILVHGLPFSEVTEKHNKIVWHMWINHKDLSFKGVFPYKRLNWGYISIDQELRKWEAVGGFSSTRAGSSWEHKSHMLTHCKTCSMLAFFCNASETHPCILKEMHDKWQLMLQKMCIL